MSPERTAREQGPEGALRAEAPDEHTGGKPGAPRGFRALGCDAGAWGWLPGKELAGAGLPAWGARCLSL